MPSELQPWRPKTKSLFVLFELRFDAECGPSIGHHFIHAIYQNVALRMLVTSLASSPQYQRDS